MNIPKTFKQFDNTPHSSIRVLIIEDDFISAEVLKALLEKIGIDNITLVQSGKEALQYFTENFDIIFTDFHLPDMDAIEIAKYYRTIIPKRDTPIICCSSDTQLNYQECINAEINELIPKPYRQEEVLEILECWLPQFNFKWV